jgi:hypothetical protein
MCGNFIIVVNDNNYKGGHQMAIDYEEFDEVWCKCKKENFEKWIGVEDHTCPEIDNQCNLVWHHYHCSDCGGVTQTG